MTTFSLKQRAIRAGILTISSQITSQVFRLASNLVLTRLLVPEMFGIMALANILIIGIHLFSDIGLNQNLIQNVRGNDPDYINTVWTVQVVRGVIITTLGVGLGIGIYLLNSMHIWPISTVYAEPILPYVIAVTSLNAAVSGFASTKIALASRTMSIGRNTLIDLASQLAGIAVMIIWAWIDRSIWALVGGSLISTTISTIMSHTLTIGVKNHFHWDKSAFDEIFRFGKWIFLTSILGFLSSSADRLILGSFVDSTVLGLYAVAIFMKNALQDLLFKLSSSIGFPAFSEVYRNRPEQLKQIYYKLRVKLDIVSLLAMGFLFSAGRLIIQVLYDSRYLPAGHMLEILSIGIFGFRYGLAEHCYNAIGKPKISVPLIAIRTLGMIIIIPTGFHFYGLEGAIWAIAFSDLIYIPLAIHLKIKNHIFDLQKELIVLPVIALGYILGKFTLWMFSIF